jgi:hypothetical protein
LWQKEKPKAIDTQFHFKRMRLEGKSGEDTGHDSLKMELRVDGLWFFFLPQARK